MATLSTIGNLAALGMCLAAITSQAVAASDSKDPAPRRLISTESHYYPDTAEFEGGRPAHYFCDNGTSFAVQFDRVHSTSTAQVRYADSFDNEARRSLLLVAGPTGSGVRYTNDAAVLHLKGDVARIEIPESAGHDAFSASRCRTDPSVGDKQLTQGALAGSYHFAIDRFFPGQYERAHFAKAEVACFVAADADFFAITPAAGQFPARYYTSHGSDLLETGPMLIGEVDAGVGHRIYPIDMGYPGTLNMNFAAPGSIDGTARAMAGLSSISSGNGDRLECLDSGDYLYVGLFDDRTIAVELSESGSLIYREWHKASDDPSTEIEGGHIVYDEGQTTFYFLTDDATLYQVVAAEDGMVPPDAFFVHGPTQWTEQQARAYFIAAQETWYEKIEPLDAGFAHLLGSLEICNHLGGEGGDEERTRQVGRAQERYRCGTLDYSYDRAMADLPADSRIRAFLEANAPVWR